MCYNLIEISSVMVKKAFVPADFGKKHIGCPAHGNLTFKLKNGYKTQANSMIMSLNSPVIDDLTTEQDKTTLDLGEYGDFSSAVVDSFIEACYTGEIRIRWATFNSDFSVFLNFAPSLNYYHVCV